MLKAPMKLLCEMTKAEQIGEHEAQLAAHQAQLAAHQAKLAVAREGYRAMYERWIAEDLAALAKLRN